MASGVRNIHVKTYYNLTIGFQVTVENVGDVFETQCTLNCIGILGRLCCNLYQLTNRPIRSIVFNDYLGKYRLT